VMFHFFHGRCRTSDRVLVLGELELAKGQPGISPINTLKGQRLSARAVVRSCTSDGSRVQETGM
jgi:hypothetical protein